MSTIGANILIFSKKKYLSIQELADKMGVSRQTLYDWKSGKNTPRQDNIDRACQILGVSEAELRGLIPPSNLTSVDSKEKLIELTGVIKHLESKNEELRQKLDECLKKSK